MYKNLAPLSDTRESIYAFQWELTATNRLEVIVVALRIGYEEQIRIVFDHVLAMQSIDEHINLITDRLRDVAYRVDVWKDEEWSVLWEVDSQFWSDVRSLHPDKTLKHYYMVGDEYLLDILSETAPTVNYLDKEEFISLV